MNKSVLMNSDIYETTKVDYVTNSSLKHHSGLKIFHIKNVTSKNRCRHALTRIS